MVSNAQLRHPHASAPPSEATTEPLTERASMVLRRIPSCEPPFEHTRARTAPAPVRSGNAIARPARGYRPTPVNPAALVRAQQVFRLTFEVLEGRRGPRQLQPLMTPELVEKVTTLARARLGRRAPGTARLNRVHVQQVTTQAAEACATVTLGGRVHAVAARMELRPQGWQCTALRIG